MINSVCIYNLLDLRSRCRTSFKFSLAWPCRPPKMHKFLSRSLTIWDFFLYFFDLAWLLWGWKAKKSAILRFVLILQSQIFQHGAENFEVFKFQSQKCFWSKFKCRHGCYNPQRIICNHLKLWICWDAQEIKRFSISFGGDIFFATGGSWSQQLILWNKVLHEVIC